MFQTLVDCEPNLLQKIENDRVAKVPTDIKEALGCFTTDIIGSVAFGLECNTFAEENSPFRKYGRKVFTLNTLRLLKITLISSFPNAAKNLGVVQTPKDVSKFFINLVKDTVSYRENNNYTRKDFLQLLIDLKNNKLAEDEGYKHDGNTLSIEEIAAQSFVFFIAGFETSSTTMTFALYELSKHPELQDKVREEVNTVLAKHEGKITYDAIQEMKYMDQVINETLRNIALVLVAVFFGYYKWTYFYWEKRKVPYLRPKIPYGNSVSPFQDEEQVGFKMKQNYEELKSRGLKHGGIFIFLQPIHLIVDLDLVRHVMTTHFNHFSSRGVYYNEEADPLGANLVAISGPKWKNLRKKISPFTIDVYGSCAFGLDCDSFKSEDSPFRTFGLRSVLVTRFIQLKTMFAMSFPTLARILGLKLIAEDISKFFSDVVTRVVTFREENNVRRNDLLQFLIDLKYDDPTGDKSLTLEEITAQCYVFFVAGFDSTASCMTFALYELSKNPDIQEKLRNEITEVLSKHQNNLTYDAIQDMEYLDQVVNETLRKYPPAPLTVRECTKDCNLPDTNFVVEEAYYKWTYQYWRRRNFPYLEPRIPFGNNISPFGQKESNGINLKRQYDTMKSKGWKHGGLYNMLKPTYLVLDLDYLRNIMAKDFQYFTDRGLYYNEKDDPLGFETSSTTMTFALYELSKHQELQDKVRDEVNAVLAKHGGKITYEAIQDMKYMDQVINEALRKYPPLPLLTRQCVLDYKIPGEDLIIEKGTSIIISILGIHYDKEYYPDPEKFDPERFTEENKKSRHHFAHIPFGEGPRVCIGMRFGLMQSKVGIASLLKQYKFTVSKKTMEPLKFKARSLTPAAEGEIWLDAEKI
ncbi:unnamed protein product [Tenebrio molitor]|nr:unnamed protein product [Tenebrio molitor]